MPSGAVIGRDREADELEARTYTHRLVTVVGPGGVGKTALARAVAERAAGRFAMGVAGVDLTRITDAAAVPGALAAQLGFESFDALLSSPNDRPVLLVVDNCEHLLDAAAHALVEILGSCRQPTVLATSRSPLELPGESVLSLSPLTLPRDGDDPYGSPSVQLFLERCHAAGASLSDDDLPAVVDLCRRLDGLPLAIEIAAARARTMTVGEIVTRLASGVDVLDRPRFRGDPRHRSVAETIRWSYDLLPPGAARLLEHLAVLPGTFGADQARAVVPADARARFDADLDEVLTASLVSADTTGASTGYRMLETVRRFALEHLRRREGLEPAYDRLADHVVASAASPAGDRNDSTPGGLEELPVSYDQVAEALAWCVEHDSSPTRAHTLCGVLGTVVHRQHATDIAASARRTLERWPEHSPGRLRTAATLADAEYVTGRLDRAIEVGEPALRAAGAGDGAAVTLYSVLGRSRHALGDPVGALDALRTGAATARELGLEAAALELAIDIAEIVAELGDVDTAMTDLDRVLERAAELGLTVTTGRARGAIAWVRLRADPAAALAEIDAALSDARRLDDPVRIAVDLRSLAYARLLVDDLDAAAAAVAELLEELQQRTTLPTARLLIDATAALAFRRGHPAWAALTATAEGLPSAAMPHGRLDVVPDVPAGTEPLPRHEAIGAVRRVLAELAALPQPAEVMSGPAPAPDAPAAPTATIRRHGEVWEIDFAGHRISVRAGKGLHDLARLIQAPGREIHCLDLADAGAVESSTGEVIDADARRRYEARIRELQVDIDEAERHSDYARAFRLQVEFDAIVEHLSAALGQGHRHRVAPDTAERARSAVTHRLRTAIRRLDKLHPALGSHLSHAVSTGSYCSYRPETPVTWTVD